MPFEETLDKALDLRDQRGKLQEAGIVLRLLVRQWSKLTDPERTRLCGEYGTQLRYQGKMAEALAWYKRGVVLARKTSNTAALVDFLRLISFTSLKLHPRTTTARRWAEKSLSFLPALQGRNHDLASANVWALIGNIESGDKNIAEAIAAYKKALRYARRAKYWARVATLLGDLANKYIDTGRFREAERALKEDLRLSKKYHRHSYPNALVRLSYLYYLKTNSRRDLQKALEYAQEALRISKKEGWGREIADAYQRLGKIAWYRGKKAESRRYLLLAMEQYKNVKHPSYAKWVKKVMKDLKKGINSHHDHPQE